jgi:hypothetical protein
MTVLWRRFALLDGDIALWSGEEHWSGRELRAPCAASYRARRALAVARRCGATLVAEPLYARCAVHVARDVCHCGILAARSPVAAWSIGADSATTRDAPVVLGRCRARGPVAARGGLVRAAALVVEALYAPPWLNADQRAELEAVAARYQVPLFPERDARVP